MCQRNIQLVLITYLLFTTSLFAQWEVKYVDPDVLSLHKIAFFDQSLGFAMGTSGTILKTTDSGENWQLIQTAFDFDIYDFEMITSDTIYAVGAMDSQNPSWTSFFMASFDSGNNWSILKEFPLQQLQSLAFIDGQEGILSGSGGIHRTLDGGTNWEAVYNLFNSDYQYGSVEQVRFTSNGEGYGLLFARNPGNIIPPFDYVILKTFDGGANWYSYSHFEHQLLSIHSLNKDTLFLTDGYALFRSLDGGMVWDTMSRDDGNVYIRTLALPNDTLVYGVGYPFAMIPEISPTFTFGKSVNTGQNWKTHTQIGFPLESICFLNESTGFVAGHKGIIMKTEYCGGDVIGDYPWFLINTTEINESKRVMLVAPNPAKNDIHILPDQHMGRPLSIIIMDSIGKIRKQLKVEQNGPIECNVEFLENGVYHVLIAEKHRTYMQKFIKM